MSIHSKEQRDYDGGGSVPYRRPQFQAALCNIYIIHCGSPDKLIMCEFIHSCALLHQNYCLVVIVINNVMSCYKRRPQVWNKVVDNKQLTANCYIITFNSLDFWFNRHYCVERRYCHFECRASECFNIQIHGTLCSKWRLKFRLEPMMRHYTFARTRRQQYEAVPRKPSALNRT